VIAIRQVIAGEHRIRSIEEVVHPTVVLIDRVLFKRIADQVAAWIAQVIGQRKEGLNLLEIRWMRLEGILFPGNGSLIPVCVSSVRGS